LLPLVFYNHLFEFLTGILVHKQKPLVNNGHYFWISRVVVVHRFNSKLKYMINVVDFIFTWFNGFAKNKESTTIAVKHPIVESRVSSDKLNGLLYYNRKFKAI
jgi:hypothetical protein